MKKLHLLFNGDDEEVGADASAPPLAEDISEDSNADSPNVSVGDDN